MDADIDLSAMPREDLLALIAQLQAVVQEQQTVIAQLQRRIEALEGKAKPAGPKGMPGIKPKSGRRPTQNKGPRKPRPHGFARQRMTPTHRVAHAMESCLDCGTRLSGGWTHRTREVIDLPVVPVQVTEHVFIARTCPVCEQRRVPKVDLSGVALGKQRLGVSLLSLMAALREEGRLPFRTIQWYLQTVHQLRLSVGAIVRAVHQVARQAQPAVDRILERIRGSPVVHADETGWRQDGANGYVWTFSTPAQRYFLRRGRHKEVVDEVLDESFSGVLVSDFYAAYHHYPGLKQRCWVHLLRDIHDLKSLYPKDRQLARWAAAVHHIYSVSKSFAHPQARQRQQVQQQLERKLLAQCRPYAPGPGSRPRQPVPTYREAHQGTLRFRGCPRHALGQQRCGAKPAALGNQPQNQRRHPLEAGHRHQDDLGLPLRHLARPGVGPSHRLPSTPLFPSTLNCYSGA